MKIGNFFENFLKKESLFNEKKVIILDFDGYMIDIQSKNYIQILDDIHTLLSNEFENTIKDPIYKFMRKEK